jgi:hypothetical protein
MPEDCEPGWLNAPDDPDMWEQSCDEPLDERDGR